LAIIAFIQAVRLVRIKGLRPFTLQHAIYVAICISVTTFMIRAGDPGSLQDKLPLILLYWCTDICTTCVYTIIFIVVMSWVRLIQIISDGSKYIRQLELFEKGMIWVLWTWTFICSTCTVYTHPSYKADVTKTLFFIIFNIIVIAVGWVHAIPIYKTLFNSGAGLSEVARKQKKKQVQIVLFLMLVLSICSAGCIEIQSWTIDYGLNRSWDWKYNNWGAPKPTFKGMIEAFQFDAIQYICICATLFFFRRFGGDDRQQQQSPTASTQRTTDNRNISTNMPLSKKSKVNEGGRTPDNIQYEADGHSYNQGPTGLTYAVESPASTELTTPGTSRQYLDVDSRFNTHHNTVITATPPANDDSVPPPPSTPPLASRSPPALPNWGLNSRSSNEQSEVSNNTHAYLDYNSRANNAV
jgi:hypothetical protein